MDILGLPDIGRQPELTTLDAMAKFTAVFAAVAETLPKMDRWDVFFKLADLRCVVVSCRAADLLVDPQYAARECSKDRGKRQIG